MTPKELAEVEGKPIALAWIDTATAVLRDQLEWVAGGEEPSTRALVDAALAINISFRSRGRVATTAYAWLVLGTFTRAREVIAESGRFFASATLEDVRALFPPDAGVPPAYAMYQQGVFFTPAFAPWDPQTRRGFGPLCRAAMVLHEAVHVIDRRSGRPDVHISEWQEPAFSAQTAEQSLHNPSAYASFAAQVHERALEWPASARYGAGRPSC